jgi:FkbM family methyltransferase
MKIYYGTSYNSIDVTDICLTRLLRYNIITIPACDINRARYFTDPLVGVKKKIILSLYDKSYHCIDTMSIKINTLTKMIFITDENAINDKLKTIHSKLTIKYGNLYDEVSEQKMVLRYLTGNEKVLEIGGNIGRNSLVISSILNDKSNLVVLECDDNISKQLKENRDLNNFNFNIENSALSNRKLIQKGWDTIPSDTLQEGFNWVKTISLTELKNKYTIEFDTLVLDCEGAFYYILMDMPEILTNINLIIMENDYWDINKKNYIDGILIQNNFDLDYVEDGGWGPCYDNFFEVWKK